jgi:hypothetical protein
MEQKKGPESNVSRVSSGWMYGKHKGSHWILSIKYMHLCPPIVIFFSSRALIRSSLDLDVEAAQKSRLEMNPTMPVELRVNLPHVTRQPDTEKMLLAIDTGEVL